MSNFVVYFMNFESIDFFQLGSYKEYAHPELLGATRNRFAPHTFVLLCDLSIIYTHD